MARWKESVKVEVLDLASFSDGVSGRFLSLPFGAASMGTLRREDEGEPEGNQMSAYGTTGIFSSACITCVSGATSGGLATGRPTNM